MDSACYLVEVNPAHFDEVYRLVAEMARHDPAGEMAGRDFVRALADDWLQALRRAQ